MVYGRVAKKHNRVKEREVFAAPVIVAFRSSMADMRGVAGVPEDRGIALTLEVFTSKDYKETKKSYFVRFGLGDYRLEKGQRQWNRDDGIYEFFLISSASELWVYLKEWTDSLLKRNNALRKSYSELREQMQKMGEESPVSDEWRPVKK